MKNQKITCQIHGSQSRFIQFFPRTPQDQFILVRAGQFLKKIESCIYYTFCRTFHPAPEHVIQVGRLRAADRLVLDSEARLAVLHAHRDAVVPSRREAAALFQIGQDVLEARLGGDLDREEALFRIFSRLTSSRSGLFCLKRYRQRLDAEVNVEIGEKAGEVAVDALRLVHALALDPEVAVGYVIFLLLDLLAAAGGRVLARAQRVDFLVLLAGGLAVHLAFELEILEGAHDDLLALLDVFAGLVSLDFDGLDHFVLAHEFFDQLELEIAKYLSFNFKI